MPPEARGRLTPDCWPLERVRARRRGDGVDRHAPDRRTGGQIMSTTTSPLPRLGYSVSEVAESLGVTPTLCVRWSPAASCAAAKQAAGAPR
jgi:hypothetical protein